MHILPSDRPEMPRMRLSTRGSRTAPSAAGGSIQAQCADDSLPAFHRSASDILCDEKTAARPVRKTQQQHYLVDNEKHFSILENKILTLRPGIDLWCNGSTTDFGSVCRGSNPLRSTETHEQIFFHNFTFFDDYTRSYQRV